MNTNLIEANQILVSGIPFSAQGLGRPLNNQDI
jgi:hypothetical protein